MTAHGRANIIARVLGAALPKAGAALIAAAFAFAPYDAGAGLSDQNAWRYQKVYKYNFTLGYSYEKTDGDTADGERIGQNYGAGLSGYIVDPRLASFKIAGNYKYDINSGTYGDSNYWLTGLDANLSLFNRIDANKGLKLWRYIPSPVTLVYGQTDSENSVTKNYGASMYYTRQGNLRFFGEEGFLYYDDGSVKPTTANNNQQNANRYRSKYNRNGNGNWNRNGNGNWNRNGNGNWNRNGNGNWNRNGNGNWNRNGNGNWNRNGNGNWNRNGNGNWNRNGNGNWNRNGNGNWNRNGNGNYNGKAGGNWEKNVNSNWDKDFNNAPRKPMGVKFPSLSADWRKNEWEVKHTQYKGETTYGRFNAFANNMPENGSSYESKYDFEYTYVDYEKVKDEKYRFKGDNKFENVEFSYGYEEHISGDRKSQGARVSGGTNGNFENKNHYGADVTGTYANSDGAESYGYALDLTGGQGYRKTVNLSPKLTSTTSLRGSYNKSGEQNSAGDYYDREVYYVGVNEHLLSTHIKRLQMSADANVGYSESGVPFKAGLYANTAGFRRGAASAGYEYSRDFPKDRKNERTESRYFLKGNYLFTYTFSGSAGVSRVESKTSDTNGGYRRETTRLDGGMDWRITPASSFNAAGTAEYEENDDLYNITANYRARMFSKGSFALSYRQQWSKLETGKYEEYKATYGWSKGKFNFSADYESIKEKNGKKNQKIAFKASRSFGGRL